MVIHFFLTKKLTFAEVPKKLQREILDSFAKRGLSTHKLDKAIEFAIKYHESQKRLTGEAFVTHPLRVAIEVAKYTSCEDTVVAAVLHDVCEDTDCTLTRVEREFGIRVMSIVDAVTRCRRPSGLQVKRSLALFFQDAPPQYSMCFSSAFLRIKDNDIITYSRLFYLLNDCVERVDACRKGYYSFLDNIDLENVVRDLVHLIEMESSESSSISVIENLRIAFFNFNDDVLKSACLVKVLDRLDNLDTINVFSQEKQCSMIEKSVSDILPLAIFLDIDSLLQKVISYLSKHTSKLSGSFDSLKIWEKEKHAVLR